MGDKGQRISQPMRIVGPIQLLRGCVIYLFFIYIFFFLGGGSTNERPGSNHVSWGPMRGLGKNRMGRGKTHTQTDTQTHDYYKESA